MKYNKKNELGVHTLSAYVANKPGVLARIAQVFARRGYNIDALVVSPSGKGEFSRMTITISGDPQGLEQIILQVSKLVDVLHCVEHSDFDAVVKELALIKIGAGPEERTEVLQIAEHFGARSVDLTQKSMVLMITGSSEKLDAMIDMLNKYPVIEMVRTGKVVMARGDEET
ncbi:MAG: acetolactate synthase small subunit [Spartobacteria bacterium]|nr:acetolactate synthase small subunit [Spartobacteria bacterium]